MLPNTILTLINVICRSNINQNRAKYRIFTNFHHKSGHQIRSKSEDGTFPHRFSKSWASTPYKNARDNFRGENYNEKIDGEVWWKMAFFAHFWVYFAYKTAGIAPKIDFFMEMVVMIKINPPKKLHSGMGVSRRFSKSCYTEKLL